MPASISSSPGVFLARRREFLSIRDSRDGRSSHPVVRQRQPNLPIQPHSLVLIERHTSASDFQLAKKRNAGCHHIQIHLDKIILDATDFRCGKDFLPIQTVLSDRHDFLGFRGPALHVHGNEASRIFREIFRCVVAVADRRDLKLELHQFRIERSNRYHTCACHPPSTVRSLRCAGPAGCRPSRPVSPILLYSSAARFTSSMVGFSPASRLGTSICVNPTSFAHAMRSS